MNKFISFLRLISLKIKHYENLLNVIVVITIAVIGVILFTNGIDKADDIKDKFGKFKKDKIVLTLTANKDYISGQKVEAFGQWPNSFFVENDSTIYICKSPEKEIVKYVNGKIETVFTIITEYNPIDIYILHSRNL